VSAAGLARALALVALLGSLLPAPALAAKKPLAPGERLDLNRAGAAELMRLPGVGRKRADAIVAFRARRPFRRPEDVLHVKGLSRSWFERVKGHLAAGEPGRSPAPASPSRR
jgi:competence protein ComEA